MSSKDPKFARKTKFIEYKHYQIEESENGFFVVMKKETGCLYCRTIEEAQRYIDLIVRNTDGNS